MLKCNSGNFNYCIVNIPEKRSVEGRHHFVWFWCQGLSPQCQGNTIGYYVVNEIFSCLEQQLLKVYDIGINSCIFLVGLQHIHWLSYGTAGKLVGEVTSVMASLAFADSLQHWQDTCWFRTHWLCHTEILTGHWVSRHYWRLTLRPGIGSTVWAKYCLVNEEEYWISSEGWNTIRMNTRDRAVYRKPWIW